MASITSATSGPSNVGSTWTGGVVPVVGDKVTIAHPGTNNVSSTPYTLNGERSAGDTTIPVTGGSGTIGVGECIQIEHQIGTGPDGQLIYDNTYYQVTTGIAGAGSLVITPGLAYAMDSGLRVNNRGHVITLEANHTWGDDTSSNTIGSSAINVSGTLRASRTVSQTLTARGSIFIVNRGAFDYGTLGDEIPSGVVATLELNDSATLSLGKHGLFSPGQVDVTWRARGIVRTRNTRLTSGISAGATSITVDDSDGWAIGDRIVIASDTDDPARAQTVVISGGSAPTWAVPAITNARDAGCRVGNLSSNVVIKSKSGAFCAPVAMTALNTSAPANFTIDVGDVRFEDTGGTSAGLVGLQPSPPYTAGLGISAPSSKKITCRGVAVESVSSLAGGKAGLCAYLSHFNRPRFVDFAVSVSNGGEHGIYHAGQSSADFDDGVIYRSTNAHNFAFGGPASNKVSGGESWASGNATAGNETGRATFENHFGHALASLYNTAGCSYEFIGGTYSTARLAASTAVAGFGAATFDGTSFLGSTLTASLLSGAVPSSAAGAKLANIGGSNTDHRDLNYYRLVTTDISTRNRSTYSVKIAPKVASTVITYTFTIPAVSGVAQTIKGSLRFDSTYGTATPPSIALSGQGVTQSHTCAATADAWDDFSFTFTPTSTGDITATVTVQSTSTSGSAWLDGVWHYPMTQSVRHFGYLWQPQAAQVADPSITVSEATALAYPVAVDHGTNTITLSGDCTARQIYEACMADLVQTANQGEAVHITTSDLGVSFTTTYTVDVGAFAVTGPYTDSAGLHVDIRADNLLTGSRVQIYNVTDSTELLNAVTSGAGLVYPIVAPGTAKTIRLRVAKVGYLPIEAFGVLSGGSVSFLDSQVVDTVYVTNGIDGSAVSGLTPDYPNLQIDASIAGGSISVQDIYAWTRFANTAEDGIRLMHNSVQASDTANYTIDTSVVDARFDNNSATPLMISGGMIRRSDGTTVIGEGSIQLDPGRAYVATDIAADVANLALVHGLIAGSPLEVTATTRTAGAVSQTISTVSGTTTVSRV